MEMSQLKIVLQLLYDLLASHRGKRATNDSRHAFYSTACESIWLSVSL